MRRQQTHVAGENDQFHVVVLPVGEGCLPRAPPLTVVARPAPVQPLPPAGRVASHERRLRPRTGWTQRPRFGGAETLGSLGSTNASIPLPEPERKTAQRSGASAEAMRPPMLVELMIRPRSAMYQPFRFLRKRFYQSTSHRSMRTNVTACSVLFIHKKRGFAGLGPNLRCTVG